MIYKLDKNLLDQFINDYAEGKLSNAELQSFSELQDVNTDIRRIARAGMQARSNLQKLPKVKCRPGFDSRMAAKFSMELEREVQMLNKSQTSFARA